MVASTAVAFLALSRLGEVEFAILKDTSSPSPDQHHRELTSLSGVNSGQHRACRRQLGFRKAIVMGHLTHNDIMAYYRCSSRQ